MTQFDKDIKDIATLFNPSIFNDILDGVDVFGKSTVPYNVEQIHDKDNELKATKIEIALAGYDKEDISIKVIGDELTVAAKAKEDNKDRDFIHKGIHQRSFTLTWTLAGPYDRKDVKGKFNNGLLTIYLNVVKEEVNTIQID